MDRPNQDRPAERPTAQVSQELLDQLHQANETLHQAKQELERVMDGSDYRHEERVDAAMECFRQAECEVEEVEKRISEKLQAKS